jgi:hypothetical protein
MCYTCTIAKHDGATMRVHLLSAVNSANISRTGDMYTIRNVVPIVDNITLNGILYPAAEVDKSYLSMNNTPAPISHPKDADGNFVSAADAVAMQQYWVGAAVTNARKDGEQVLVDITVNANQAAAMDSGKRLLERLDAAIAGNAGEPIHVSTGVFLRKKAAKGESKGKAYNAIASDMTFDHLAILLDEQGAGTPEEGVGMWLNQAGESEVIYSVNLDVEQNSISQSTDVELHQGDSPTINHREESSQMKDAIIAALNAAGISHEGRSDADVLAAYNALQRKELEQQVNTLTEKIVGMEANEKQRIEGEKRAIADKLAVNSTLTADDYMALPLERLQALNAKAAPVVVGNASQAAKSERYDLNKLQEE